jgi:type I restriction enzyme S subunit
MANGSMTTNTREEKAARQALVEEGFVDCIVQLPDKLFFQTGIPCCLWFLSKNRDGRRGYRPRRDEILFVDARALGQMVNRRQRALSDDDIHRRIAEILGRLDDKIEVNRRINRTLERMAQVLYKHWFVDFGPFQDGEFVESEVGLVPRGWEVGALGDIARNDKNLVDPREIDRQTPYIGLGDMPQGSITLDTWGVAGDSISTKCKMKQGQILFGKLRPYFKKVGIAPVEGVCSTDILVVVPMQDEYHSLVLCQLIQQDFIDYTEAVSDGTRMPRVSWEMMAKYPMLIPDRATELGFNEIVRPWLEIIAHDVMENRSLAATRDYLLPRLLAGEVSPFKCEKNSGVQ